MAEKNLLIASILSLIITGSGNLYNGFITRFAVEFFMDLVVLMLIVYIYPSDLLLVVLVDLLFRLYFLVDTIRVTKAINTHQEIPLLFKRFDIR